MSFAKLSFEEVKIQKLNKEALPKDSIFPPNSLNYVYFLPFSAMGENYISGQLNYTHALLLKHLSGLKEEDTLINSLAQLKGKTQHEQQQIISNLPRELQDLTKIYLGHTIKNPLDIYQQTLDTKIANINNLLREQEKKLDKIQKQLTTQTELIKQVSSFMGINVIDIKGKGKEKEDMETI